MKPADSAMTAPIPAVHRNELTTVYLKASCIMSKRFIPYSAEHTATMAPPMACATTMMM